MAQVRDLREHRSGSIDSFPLVEIKVGQVVGFKSDVEQYGKVVEIKGDYLTLESKNGFSGDYIGGKKRTQEHSRDCWIG